MRKSIYSLLLLLFFLACTNKKSSQNSDAQTDLVAETNNQHASDSIPSEEPADADKVAPFKIDFPLDSLLSFDSEAELKAVFPSHVKRSVGYYPEGMGEYANTLLFQDSKNEVAFVWKDDTLNFSGLAYIELSGKDTDWKTAEGITIGTGIKELESFNKKPFMFYGLGWDYAGMIDWQEGYLSERKIFGHLDYPDEIMPAEFDGLLGDHEIESSSELALKAKLVLSEITMRRSE